MLTFDQYEIIRKYYSIHEGEIIERSSKCPPAWHDPYAHVVDFVKEMTPIERDAWFAIRILGRMPLYPQYPVGKYFADFGNPKFKVAVECDGKEFHKDVEKDKRRDEEFNKLGWTVYRVPGSDCYRIVDTYVEACDVEDRHSVYMDKLADSYSRTIDGLIKALAIKYAKLPVTYDESELALSCLKKRITNLEGFQFHPNIISKDHFENESERAYEDCF